MEKSEIFNRQLSIFNCLCVLLYGCIIEYEQKGIDELADILVVEGIITDDESIITLSRSVNLTGDFKDAGSYYVNYATVYVACDDGTLFHADTPEWGWERQNGQYTVKTGKLDLNRKYCLNIEIEDHQYASNFSYPIKTPEIDSVFWTKRAPGQPVNIHITTHSQDNKVLYYRWSYREDWEINADMRLDGYPFYCWNKAESRELLLGSAEKTVFGRVTDILTQMHPSSKRLSVLYRIDVKQNAISKRAYDYFANIKSNAEQTGSIFAPVPSELRGNITCITDPGRPVIGYMDVSTTTKKRKYISRRDNAYEKPDMDCVPLSKDALCEKLGIEGMGCGMWNPLETGYVLYSESTFIKPECVDCSLFGVPNEKPDDWP